MPWLPKKKQTLCSLLLSAGHPPCSLPQLRTEGRQRQFRGRGRFLCSWNSKGSSNSEGSGAKSREQSKNAADFSRLFWAPAADCLLPRPSAHAAAFSKHGLNKLKRGLNEHLAANAAACPQSGKQSPRAGPGPSRWILPWFPSAHPPPHTSCSRLCSLAPELGCPPRARKLFTKGNNSDKGLKLAGNDGKHLPPQTAILLFCISFPWGWS